MHKLKIIKAAGLIMLFVCILASCGTNGGSKGTQTKQPDVSPVDTEPTANQNVTPEPTVSATPTVTPANQNTEQPVSDSDEDQESFLGTYIGKTVGDVVKDFGEDYSVDGFHGSSMITYGYDTYAVWFLFGTGTKNITDDLVIRQIIVWGDSNAVYNLKGSMTYPQILEIVGNEAEVQPPEYWYNAPDTHWEYGTGFEYRGYNVQYVWLDDPESSLSDYVHIGKVDVPTIQLNGGSQSEESPTEPSSSPDPDSYESYINAIRENPFRGPGWFQGVMGCKFYVPEDFIQSDPGFMRNMGMHNYYFTNDELDMSIHVFECTFISLPIDASDMPKQYESSASAEGVTYTASGDGWYVVSGYDGEDTIYYSRTDYNNDSYSMADFRYPTSNANVCEEILLEFLENYSVQ